MQKKSIHLREGGKTSKGYFWREICSKRGSLETAASEGLLEGVWSGGGC